MLRGLGQELEVLHPTRFTLDWSVQSVTYARQ